MSAYLSNLINLYIFSTGRRIFALSQIKAKAAAASLGPLESHCSAALAHDQKTLGLEAEWAGNKSPRLYPPEARKIDVLIDTSLGALEVALDAETRDVSADDPLGQSAVQLHHELFPAGVGAITTANYVEELAEAERIVGILQSPKWAQVVSDLGLNRRVAKLSALTQKYRSALGGKANPIIFDQIKEAREKGQNFLLQTVAIILGLHPSDSEADIQARTELMGPILAQNEAIRLYLKARRAVPDVNPETGEPAGEPGKGQEGG